MGNARVSEFTYPASGDSVKVKVIVADGDTVKVEAISNKTLKDAGKYGINGTYYSGSQTLGIAINNNNGNVGAVADDGSENANGTIARGTMICYNSGGSRAYSFPVIAKYSDSGIALSSTWWAIGGISLHLDKTYTSDSAFFTAVGDLENPTGGVVGFDTTRKLYRTAIGYRSTDKKVILAATSTIKVWDLRSLMKDYIGCDDAVLLDSNVSTQIRGRVPADGSTPAYDVEFGHDGKVANPIYTAVTVSPSAWTLT